MSKLGDQESSGYGTSHTFVLPKQLNDGPSLWAAEKLSELDGVPDLMLDFERLTFARPFGTLVVAESLRDLVRRRKSAGLKTRYKTAGVLSGDRSPAVTYLGHVGFFTHIGIDYGKQPGQAPGSRDYLPITVLSRTELEADASGRAFQEAIEQKAKLLARMIFTDESKQDMLRYCLRETIRNAFEHAQVDACSVMAQRYSGDQVEIAIADRGIGVLASLASTHAVSTPKEALDLAVQPGITRVKDPQPGTPWDNTGFGLYVMSSLGSGHGSFRLVSSGGSLEMTKSGRFSATSTFPGTAIRLLVNASDAEYFPNILKRIVDEGERISAGAPGGGRRASKSTRSSSGDDEP